MTYWDMTIEQKSVLKEVIFGRTVLELGCGDGSLAMWCAQHASHVTAVDRYPDFPAIPPENITFKSLYFDACVDLADVLLLSWPPNYNCNGLMHHVYKHATIAYLGKNTDGTACGSNEMWGTLVRRDLIKSVPDRKNTLLIYGKCLNWVASLRDEEELAGLSNNGFFKYIPYGSMVDECSEGICGNR